MPSREKGARAWVASAPSAQNQPTTTCSSRIRRNVERCSLTTSCGAPGRRPDGGDRAVPLLGNDEFHRESLGGRASLQRRETMTKLFSRFTRAEAPGRRGDGGCLSGSRCCAARAPLGLRPPDTSPRPLARSRQGGRHRARGSRRRSLLGWWRAHCRSGGPGRCYRFGLGLSHHGPRGGLDLVLRKGGLCGTRP